MKVKDIIAICDPEDEIFVARKPKDDSEIPSLINVVDVDRVPSSYDDEGTRFNPFVYLLFSENEDDIIEFEEDDLDSLVEPEH